MSKNFKRTLALALAVVMMAGLFAAVPTASAEVTTDDVIFDLDFAGFKTGDPIVDQVTGTTLSTQSFEAKNAFADSKGVTRNGIYLTGDKTVNGITWTSDVLDPFKETEGGFTMNMWIYLNDKQRSTHLFAFTRNCTDTNRNNLIMQVQASDSNTISTNTCCGANDNANKCGSYAYWHNVYSKQWYMVTLAQDPTDKEYHLYINGKDMTMGEFVGPYSVYEIATNQAEDYIATYAVGGNGIWKSDPVMKGVLGDVTVYGRELTADEIATMYTEESGLTIPDKDPNIVEDLVCYDDRQNGNTDNMPMYRSWLATGNVAVGDRVYYDRAGVTLGSIPEAVVGGDLITTAMSSKTDLASGATGLDTIATFKVAQRASVYVAISTDVTTTSSTVTALTDEGYELVEGAVTFAGSTSMLDKVYKKTFDKGATVNLPSQYKTGSNMYLAFVVGEEEPAVEVDHEFSVTNSDAAVVANDEKFDITWNATVALDEGVELAALNEKATFTEYGVIYGTSAEEVAKAATGEATNNAKIKAFDKIEGEETDVDVYTIFGFRLKGVAADRARAAQFYVTYTLDGQSYTVYSDCVTATAAVAE